MPTLSEANKEKIINDAKNELDQCKSEAERKKAYHKLTKIYHPDKHTQTEKNIIARDIFKSIDEHYKNKEKSQNVDVFNNKIPSNDTEYYCPKIPKLIPKEFFEELDTNFAKMLDMYAMLYNHDKEDKIDVSAIIKNLPQPFTDFSSNLPSTPNDTSNMHNNFDQQNIKPLHNEQHHSMRVGDAAIQVKKSIYQNHGIICCSYQIQIQAPSNSHIWKALNAGFLNKLDQHKPQQALESLANKNKQKPLLLEQESSETPKIQNR